MEVSVRLVGSAAFKAVGTSDPRPAGSIPVHLRQFVASRIRMLLFCAFGFIALVPPSGASADPAEPGNTESVVESVTPTNQAVRVDIVGADAFVRVRVDPGHTLEVNGYYDEPFLRIDNDGRVSVNERSETFRISTTRYGVGTSPNVVEPEREDPNWVVASNDGTYLWHDHRVHWMGIGTPPTIDDGGLVQQWAIAMTIDGKSTMVSGNLYLRTAPGSWWWLLAVPAIAVGFTFSRRRAPRGLAGAGAVCAVTGGLMFWGIAPDARGAPVMFALGVVAVVISLASVIVRRRGEIVDALVASAAVAVVVALVIERDIVTKRFVPGLGDSVVVRLVTPLVAGLALGTGARALKRLLGKPEVAASA